MVGRDELLKETRGEKKFHDDLGAESDRTKAWRPMSEVVSLAVLLLDSRSAYHLAKKSGNFGLKSNGKVISGNSVRNCAGTSRGTPKFPNGISIGNLHFFFLFARKLFFYRQLHYYIH